MENNGVETYFDADEIVELIDYFEMTDDFDHYRKTLQYAQKLHPENPDVRTRICRMYIYDEKYAEALSLIEKIGEADDLELNLLKMECFCALDRYEEVSAYIDAQEMMESDDLEDIYEYLAPVLNGLEKYEQSCDLIRRGLEHFPENMVLKEELCYYYEAQGETEQALALVSELIDYDPYEGDFWYMQGRLHFFNGDYDKAVESLDFALTCDDTDTEIKILKIYSLFMNGDYDKAIDLYMELMPDDDEIADWIDRNEDVQPGHIEEVYILLRNLLKNTDVSNELNTNWNEALQQTPADGEEGGEADENSTAPISPGDILLHLLQMFAYTVKGEQEKTVEAAENLLQLLFRIGKELDIHSLHDMPFGQLIRSLMEEMKSVFERKVDSSFAVIHAALQRLLEDDLAQFCHCYGRCTPQTVEDYLNWLYEQFGGKTIRTVLDNVYTKKTTLRHAITPENLVNSYLMNKYNRN
jgi:tetratricopeptide (TPR) repeat protein